MRKKGNDNLNEQHNEDSAIEKDKQGLIENIENAGPEIEEWSIFVEHNKRKVPDNLNDKLWNSFHSRVIRRNRLRIGIVSAAASILILVSLLIGAPEQRKQSYDEKAELLNQALKMFDDEYQESKNETIIYKDEVIIIYSSLE